MILVVNLTNTSVHHASSTLWTSTDIFSLINLIAIILTNGATLFIYGKCPPLRANTFSLYLINLLLSNIFKALSAPFEMIQHLTVEKDQSAAYCSALIAFGYTSNAIMMHCHVLITLNRVWAITFPLGYRNHHSRTTAIVLCVSMWVYVFLWLLPGIIVDGLWYHTENADSTCLLNNSIPSQRNWNMAAQVIIYTIPILIVILAYPLIWCKRKKQKRLRPMETLSVKEGSSAPEKETRGHSHSFKVLTLLTVSVIVCWTPLTCFYNILVFGDRYIGWLYEVGWVLWEIEPVFDPLLFAVALKSLRVEYKRLLCR